MLEASSSLGLILLGCTQIAALTGRTGGSGDGHSEGDLVFDS